MLIATHEICAGRDGDKKSFEGSAGVKLNGSAPLGRAINWMGTGPGAHWYEYFMSVMSRVATRAPRPVPLPGARASPPRPGRE